ncbi:MAG: cytochrome c biogenesis protein ResB [Thermodesulfobacteriota bacterium]
MFKRMLNYIGSKRFSMTLLKIGAWYFLYLAVMWITGLIPPAGYMVWVPLSIWAAFFFINMGISLVTQKYAYKGNIVFHAAFIIVAIGIITSAIFRFAGETVVVEGESFFGDEKEYAGHSAGKSFDKFSPGVSFKVSGIEPVFWKDALYFTGLKAALKYPAETLENDGDVWLNDGVKINGARLRLIGFGYFPELHIENNGALLYKGYVEAKVFPPGAVDSIEIKGYKIFMRFYPDAVVENGKVSNRTLYLKEPALAIRVEWMGNAIGDGILKKGESVRFGGATLAFTGARRFVNIGIVKDPGESIVFVGFVVGLIGLGLRLFERRKSDKEQVANLLPPE